MRNVTITMDEETARWLRVEAAERDTSVSRLVGELLRKQMVVAGEYERALRSFRERSVTALTVGGAAYPDRDDVHAR